MPKPATGTREWSDVSVNIQRGCRNGCRYCYARCRPFKPPIPYDEWIKPVRYPKVIAKGWRKRTGKVFMFPSCHDIRLENLDDCLMVLEKLLKVGNKVLIVSKPHLKCVRAMCHWLKRYRKQVMFRFTIGGRYAAELEYWEPGAPSFISRVVSLEWAYQRGWATSVSCEPLLYAADAEVLFHCLTPYVTDTIWFGKMNHIRQRCVGVCEEEIARIEAGQTDEAVQRVYEALKDEPKVRWKDSYRKVLGLPPQEE